MKKLLKSLLTISLFTSVIAYSDCGECATAKNCCKSCNSNCCNNCCYDCNACCLGPCDGYPFLAYRSQSRNAARELVGWQQFINQADKKCMYGAFYTTLEYTRSFKPRHLARYLFGCDLDCCNTLLIQGSQVPDRSPRAWLADYFGLAPDFSSRVSFCPHIENVIIDFNFYLGLDELTPGLFFRVQAPIAWTKWELNMCECIKEAGTLGFLAGYMNNKYVPDTQQDFGVAYELLPKSFTEAASGNITFGDMKECMKFGRITNCRLTETRLADLRASFGYNFVLKKDMHLGAFLHAAAPTGNKPDACYLFEPIVGNGKHWELGVGITGSYIFWRSQEYDERYMGVWLEATLTHLFRNCQCRSFDFCCKPNSRYMLLTQMGTNNDGIKGDVDGTITSASHQYKKNLIPAINWSTFMIDVEIPLQADIAIKVGYTRCNWNFDLGYNLWARSGEKFCHNCCHDCCDDCCNGCCTSACTCSSDKQFAIKGDSFLYGSSDGTITGNVYPLSATQCHANIHGGKNYPEKSDANTDRPATNPGVNNATYAFAETDELFGLGLGNTQPDDQIRTSIQPIIIAKKMLNLGRSPNAITHKLFTNIGYAWKDRNDAWIPFIGMGGEIEFAQTGDCCDDCKYSSSCWTNSCSHSCSGCGACCNGFYDDNCCTKKRAGVHQFGIWLKGGISFD